MKIVCEIGLVWKWLLDFGWVLNWELNKFYIVGKFFGGYIVYGFWVDDSSVVNGVFFYGVNIVYNIFI